MTPQETCEAYIEVYETLTPAALDRLPDLVDDQVRFQDPFNDLRGPKALRGVLEDAVERLKHPRFRIEQRAWSGSVCFLLWRMEAADAGRLGRPWIVEGVSELHFGADGRIVLHRDHWDAASQLYERLPLLGGLLRTLRRRLAAPPA